MNFKKKLGAFLAVALACVGFARADYTINGLTVSESSTVTLGEWNASARTLIAYAKSSHIPLVLFRANGGCSQCAKLETACSTSEVQTWAKDRQLVMCFIKHNDNAADVSAAKELTPTSLIDSSSMPKIAVYWWKEDGTEVKNGWVGRTGQMGSPSSLSLAQQFIIAVESVIGDYGDGSSYASLVDTYYSDSGSSGSSGTASSASVEIDSTEFDLYKGFSINETYAVSGVTSSSTVTVRKSSGSLPSGVKLKYNKSSQTLTLSGTPKKAGTYTYSFYLNVRSGGTTTQTATTTLTFNVTDPASLATSDANYNPVAGRKTTFEIPLYASGTDTVAALLKVSTTTANKVSAKVSAIVSGRSSLKSTSFSGSWSSLEDGTLSTSLTKSTATLTLAISRTGTVDVSVSGLSTAYGTSLTAEGVAIAVVADGANYGTLPTATNYAAYPATSTVDVTSRSTGASLGTLTVKIASRTGKVTCRGKLSDGSASISVSGSTYFYPGVTTVSGATCGEFFVLKSSSRGRYFLDVAIPPSGTTLTDTTSASYLTTTAGGTTSLDFSVN